MNSWQLAAGDQQKRGPEEPTGFEVEKRQKKDFDRSVTDRLNWGLTFVFNKAPTPGWGR
jgi:hypothetical protein